MSRLNIVGHTEKIIISINFFYIISAKSPIINFYKKFDWMKNHT